MFAIIETGGKQYRVAEGDIIAVEKLNAQVGDAVEIKEVLVIENGDKTVVGTPYVDGASVKAEVLEQGKAEKVIIFKYKAKKDYRRKKGHRQPYTQLQIKSVSFDAAEAK